jgi:uncharacterized protein (TIGR04255 family)
VPGPEPDAPSAGLLGVSVSRRARMPEQLVPEEVDPAAARKDVSRYHFVEDRAVSSMKRMNPWPKLQRTPIVEALIDLRVDPRPDLVVDDLVALQGLLGEDPFPHVIKQTAHASHLAELSDDLGRSSQLSGWLFRSADQSQAVQAQHDGFAYSRLTPYKSWKDLIVNAKLRWSQYVQVARPQRIRRISVRYINRIKLPLPVEDFADWIESFPRTPACLPQGLTEAFQRLEIPVSDLGQTMAIVTLGVQPYRVDDREVEVIFDLDLYQAATWPVDGPEIWDALDSLRPLKNRFFFAYLTSKTLELFK